MKPSDSQLATTRKLKLGIPGRLDRCHLELPEGLRFDHWAKIGRSFRNLETSMLWWIGDWLNYGEAHYGTRYETVLDQGDNSYSYGTLRNCKSIAQKFPLSRRCDKLTFSHHAAVSSLPEKEQDRLLSDAARNRWTVHAIESAADDVRRAQEEGERILDIESGKATSLAIKTVLSDYEPSFESPEEEARRKQAMAERDDKLFGHTCPKCGFRFIDL